MFWRHFRSTALLALLSAATAVTCAAMAAIVATPSTSLTGPALLPHPGLAAGVLHRRTTGPDLPPFKERLYSPHDLLGTRLELAHLAELVGAEAALCLCRLVLEVRRTPP
jgi:hypothetical protein